MTGPDDKSNNPPSPIALPAGKGAPGPSPMMKCPRCGFEQPKTPNCTHCGIIISRYLERQQKQRMDPVTSGPEAESEPNNGSKRRKRLFAAGLGVLLMILGALLLRSATLERRDIMNRTGETFLDSTETSSWKDGFLEHVTLHEKKATRDPTRPKAYFGASLLVIGIMAMLFASGITLTSKKKKITDFNK